MKAIYILLSVVLAGILFGCDDFLERSAQNMIVPEKVEHYRELLQGMLISRDYMIKQLGCSL